jgi:hypothetical protein
MLVLLVRGGFNRLEIPFSGSVVPKTWSWPISTFLSGASWLISNFTVCVVAFDFVERERKGIRRLGWCDPTKAQIWSRTMRLFNWWWNHRHSRITSCPVSEWNRFQHRWVWVDESGDVDTEILLRYFTGITGKLSYRILLIILLRRGKAGA